MPRLFSYLMTHDTGFAPNPFHGTLTLATCKPGIRRTKEVGDWVAGFASRALVANSKMQGVLIPHQGLIYLMRIDKTIPLEEYFNTIEFQNKKPTPEINKLHNLANDYGDNIYYRDHHGMFQQLQNGNHDEDHMPQDTEGLNVLISDTFYYFGRNCPVLEADLINSNFRIPVGPTYYGYQSSEDSICKILRLLHSKDYLPGVHGDPCLWGEKTNKLSCGSNCSIK